MIFRLDEAQLEKYENWKQTLPDACQGAIGGRFVFMFVPTTIGLVCKVQDQVSKQEIDLTDYEMF